MIYIVFVSQNGSIWKQTIFQLIFVKAKSLVFVSSIMGFIITKDTYVQISTALSFLLYGWCDALFLTKNCNI